MHKLNVPHLAVRGLDSIETYSTGPCYRGPSSVNIRYRGSSSSYRGSSCVTSATKHYEPVHASVSYTHPFPTIYTSRY
jgi:hypothetical protein